MKIRLVFISLLFVFTLILHSCGKSKVSTLEIYKVSNRNDYDYQLVLLENGYFFQLDSNRSILNYGTYDISNNNLFRLRGIYCPFFKERITYSTPVGVITKSPKRIVMMNEEESEFVVYKKHEIDKDIFFQSLQVQMGVQVGVEYTGKHKASNILSFDLDGKYSQFSSEDKKRLINKQNYTVTDDGQRITLSSFIDSNGDSMDLEFNTCYYELSLPDDIFFMFVSAEKDLVLETSRLNFK